MDIEQNVMQTWPLYVLTVLMDTVKIAIATRVNMEWNSLNNFESLSCKNILANNDQLWPSGLGGYVI